MFKSKIAPKFGILLPWLLQIPTRPYCAYSVLWKVSGLLHLFHCEILWVFTLFSRLLSKLFSNHFTLYPDCPIFRLTSFFRCLATKAGGVISWEHFRPLITICMILTVFCAKMFYIFQKISKKNWTPARNVSCHHDLYIFVLNISVFPKFPEF